MHGTALPSPLRDLWRVLLAALLIVLLLELLYLVAANALLASGFLERKINSDPKELLIELERPWTVVPGHVKLDGVKIRVQDSSAQFQLDLRGVAVQLSLWALTERTLHATSVRVDSTRFRYRGKIEDTPAARMQARSYAPIPGFADPPIDRGWPRGPKGKVWTLQLENIETGVSELWIQQYRYAGRGHASGSFLLKPRARLWLENARVILPPASLTLGQRDPLFSSFQVEVRGRVPELSLVDRSGIDLLRGFHGGSTLAAEVESLAFLHSYFPDSGVQLSGGRGPVEAKLDVAGGKLLPGSRARYETERIGVRTERVELAGDANVNAGVAATGERPTASLSIAAGAISLSSLARGKAPEPARLVRPRVELASHSLEIGRPWRVSRGSFALPEILIPDLVLIDQVVEQNKSWKLLQGSASASSSAEIEANGRLRGTFRGRLDRLRARFGGVALSTNARLSLGLVQQDVTRFAGSYEDFDLLLSELAFATKDGPSSRGRIHVTASRVPYEDFAPRRVDARVEAEFEDAEPILDALGITRSTLPNVLAEVLDLSHLRLTADVHHAASSTELRLHQARTDAVRAQGVLRTRNRRTDGAFLLTPSIARTARTGITINDGETSVSFLVGRDWLSEQARARGFRWPGSPVTSPKTR